ncbi:MAG: hypothetical protein J6B41_07350 [Alistipes sp.]|nr:hypothetical protein [Alistipes sp.]
MATINKKLIHFRSLSDFEARLAAGDILSTSIVWIKDAKKIWTHGEYYDCNGGGDNVYIFNPDGVASEEYAGLQDAVNNGKTVVIWAENAGAAPVVCTVVYGFYSTDAYFVSYAQAIVNGEDGATNYASMNVSQTAIESIGMVSAPIISSLKTINGESIVGSGNIAISGGGDSYVPMPETFIEQGGAINHTLLPNSSLYACLIGSGPVNIYLQEPISFDVVNEYTMIFRTFGFGNPITIDKTIIWANDNPPTLDDSVAEILEISVKCINAPAYDGIQYLGTWAKYSV